MPASSRSNHEPHRSGFVPVQAVLIAVQPPSVDDVELERSLAELRQLLAGLGVRVAHEIVQKRGVSSSPSFLGAGKLREVAALTGGSGEVARGPKPSAAPASR